MAEVESVGSKEVKLKRKDVPTEFGHLFTAKFKESGATSYEIIFKAKDLEVARKLTRRYAGAKKLTFINVKPFLVDLEAEIEAEER